MASKSALTHSGERSEVGVGKTRAVLLVKWQNGGQRYEKIVARIGGKKKKLKKCSIDLHLALHHLGTRHFVGIVIYERKSSACAILLKCKVSRIESEMEVSGVRVQERSREAIKNIYIYTALCCFINNTVFCHQGSLGTTFERTKQMWILQKMQAGFSGVIKNGAGAFNKALKHS